MIEARSLSLRVQVHGTRAFGSHKGYLALPFTNLGGEHKGRLDLISLREFDRQGGVNKERTELTVIEISGYQNFEGG